MRGSLCPSEVHNPVESVVRQALGWLYLKTVGSAGGENGAEDHPISALGQLKVPGVCKASGRLRGKLSGGSEDHACQLHSFASDLLYYSHMQSWASGSGCKLTELFCTLPILLTEPSVSLGRAQKHSVILMHKYRPILVRLHSAVHMQIPSAG